MKKHMIIIFMVASMVAQAQDSSQSKIRVYDVYLSTGMNTALDNYATLADFQKLAPNSQLLTNSLAGYTPYTGFSITGNPSFSARLGINFMNKNKTYINKYRQLQLGIFFSPVSIVSGGYYKETRVRADTLSSSSGNQTYYLDTVTRYSYNMSLRSNQLRVDAAYVFRTNPDGRWSLFGGIGVNGGIGINTFAEVSYSEFSSIESEYTSAGSVSVSPVYLDNKYVYERMPSSMSYGASVYLPFGIDFRVGKKRELLKHLHLFLETRPCISISGMAGFKTVAAPGMASGFGLRYSIN